MKNDDYVTKKELDKYSKYLTDMIDMLNEKVSDDSEKDSTKKKISYDDKSYLDKRTILRNFSVKWEINNFITIMADRIYSLFMTQYYNEINRLNIFTDLLTYYHYIKQLLVDGYLAFEIIYDKNHIKILGLSTLDPATLIMHVEPKTDKILWIQNPTNEATKRVLTDSQIIYISLHEDGMDGTSYVENLIQPYNQYVLVKEARLISTINKSSVYKKFIIPTNGLTRQQVKQQIHQLMVEYNEDVKWDDMTGEIKVNGKDGIPFSKDYWFPSGDNGEPKLDFHIYSDESDDTLKWFYDDFVKASKIPKSILEFEEANTNDVLFNNYINNVVNAFKVIVLKPLGIKNKIESYDSSKIL